MILAPIHAREIVDRSTYLAKIAPPMVAAKELATAAANVPKDQ